MWKFFLSYFVFRFQAWDVDGLLDRTLRGCDTFGPVPNPFDARTSGPAGQTISIKSRQSTNLWSGSGPSIAEK